MRRNDHLDSFFAGLVLGGMMGATLAFFAPGQDREKIKEDLKKGGTKVWRRLQEFLAEKDRRDKSFKEKVNNEATLIQPTPSSSARRFFTRGGRKLN